MLLDEGTTDVWNNCTEFFLKIESAGAAGAAAGEPTTGDREADRQP